MRLERGLSGERSAATIIAESGSPGGELCDAIVGLRTSESCHCCPRLQTAPRGHGRGTRTGQELQDRPLSRTPSPPRSHRSRRIPRLRPRRGRPGEREDTGGSRGWRCPAWGRRDPAAPLRLRPGHEAQPPVPPQPPAAGSWEPVIGEAGD